MSETVSYTLRIPSNLKTFLESESKKNGKSTAALVIEACWSYLEEDRSAGSPVPPSKTEPAMAVPVSDHQNRGSSPKVDMQALRDICAGKVAPNFSEVPSATGWPTEPVAPRCRHKELCEDGEWYGCPLNLGHKGKCIKGGKLDV